MNKTKQTGGLDYFKIIAALLVIAIHTSPLSSLSNEADFVLTGIIARIAVPFFLMVTGCFLLPRYLFDHTADQRPLTGYIKKVLCLYLAAIILYLPLNIYARHFEDVNVLDLFRILLFDGTFYHLWYLPASVMGILLVYLAGRHLPFKAVMGIAVLLYIAGLLGDSYYGLIANVPVISNIYNIFFHIFSYTRNGIFYVPVFLTMGAFLGHSPGQKKQAVTISCFFVFALLMTAEGLILHFFKIQRHDSMYLFLLPCMFFLFRFLLSIKHKKAKKLRTIATYIYLIHPFIIALLHAAARVLRLEAVFAANSILYYITVSVLSCAGSILLERFAAHWRHCHAGIEKR